MGSEIKMERVQQDSQRGLMIHGRIYPYMTSGSGAPPLFLICEL